MKFFIIHLARAEHRKANVERLKAALPESAEVIDAVDANNLSVEDIEPFAPNSRSFPPYPFVLRRTEIACFLSHRKVWRLIADGPSPGAMVLEDDVVLASPAFMDAVELVTRHAGENDFVRFPYKVREKPGKVLAQAHGLCLFEPSLPGLGMQAQFVGRTAAAQLLKATETFDRPIDTTLQLVWKTGLRPYCILPSGVSEISAGIGGSTIGARKNLAARLYRELARPLYRALLWVTSRIKAP